MKTILNKSILTLSLSVMLGFSVKAKNKVSESLDIGNVTKTISEHIKFPEAIINFNKTEKVTVTFTVNEEGWVNLVIVNTKNDVLKKSVESQFLKLKLNSLKANNAYSINFNFKTV